MTITLATLPQATAQEVYNHVAKHLLTQMERSTAQNGDACVYRGPGKLKCAAGCCIADDEYKPHMENNSWKSLIREKHVPRKHGVLIQALQDIHDNSKPEEWQERLHWLAKQKRLKPFRLAA